MSPRLKKICQQVVEWNPETLEHLDQKYSLDVTEIDWIMDTFPEVIKEVAMKSNTCDICCVGQVIDDSGVCPKCKEQMVIDEMFKMIG